MRSDRPSHKQLAQFIADAVRADVIEGRLRPGEWLRQERIAREQGASQMPVREALKQLVAEGILEHVPYCGVRVVQFTTADVEDLYACRLFIEGMAARHAATSITDEELRELNDLHLRMLVCEVPGRLQEYRELNRRFHALIFTASRRSFLIRTLGQLWSAFPTMLWSNIPRAATASAPGRDDPDAEEHAAIVSALTARDPDAAEQAVRRHIQAAADALLSVMKEVLPAESAEQEPLEAAKGTE
ncbi:MAG TPA: GntR family transcriptional regulator [Thermoanaerobaculia bacterium]|nr:GntR family transcriptional regulator [Thermoanaerobaculia bacterium]